MGLLLPLEITPKLAFERLDDGLAVRLLLSSGFISGGRFAILRNTTQRYIDVAKLIKCSPPTAIAPSHTDWMKMSVLLPPRTLVVHLDVSVAASPASACAIIAVKT